jgi:acyl-ACP thioesterase
MELQYFEKEYKVHIYENGPNGKANFYSLFNFMQDIASEHAAKLGFGRDDMMKRNNFWVLSRVFATISTSPGWEDTVIVKTWPCGTDKMFALRNYEIRFPCGKLIAYASSSWLIIDQSTKRVQRPGELLSKYNCEIRPDNSPVRNAIKLTGSSENGTLSEKFKVRISDLDVNLHTNAVNYLKWVNDTYDLNFIMHHLPCSAEINYLAESMFDDEIIIRTSQEEENNSFYNHSVFRTSDNKELCRIRLEWNEQKIINQ